MKVFVHSIDLEQYPRHLKLTYGRDGSREWYEWHRGKGKRITSVVIQGYPSQGHPWVIAFIQGNSVRVVEQELTEAEKQRRVMASVVGGLGEEGLQRCFNALKALGFEVELRRQKRR